MNSKVAQKGSLQINTKQLCLQWNDIKVFTFPEKTKIQAELLEARGKKSSPG